MNKQNIINDSIEYLEYKKSFEAWDKTYSQCHLADLRTQTLAVEPMFDACLNYFSMNCNQVLDYGCGTGDILFQCYQAGNLTYGLGIDLSQKGIEYANEMIAYNSFSNLDFLVGDTSFLNQYEEEDFDGIILSNVLDVMPKSTAIVVFDELTRLLRKDGLIFLKLNPFYSETELSEIGLTKIKDNLYEEDGVLHLREVDTAAWHRAFEKKFDIIRYLEFPYSWQDGMNRLFLLQKK